MNARTPPTAALAAAAAAFPVVVEIAVTSVWWDRLPAQIATTFGPDGSPSGYGSPLGTAVLLAVVQALFLVAAVGSACAQDRRKGRVSCAATTASVASLAISWLIIAGVAASLVDPAAWWALFAGPAWAFIPYCLLRPRKEAK